MTRVVASDADAGRPCPYCHFAIKPGAPAERCDACSSLHHADCWHDGGGCAIHGCAMAGSAPQQTVGIGAPHPAGPPPPGALVMTQLPPTQVYASQVPPGQAPPAGPVPPGYPPSFSYPRRGVSSAVLAVAALIALLGIGTGVVVATGVLSGGTHPSSPTQPAVTAHGSPVPKSVAPATPTAPEQRAARSSIMSLLADYQSSYSAHDVGGLASIFSPGITRHGLAAGGCTVARGRRAVLGDYRSQFEAGSGSYRLIGLTPQEIAIDSIDRAHLDAHYEIDPGGTGYVNFKFAALGGGWKISEVYATCD